MSLPFPPPPPTETPKPRISTWLATLLAFVGVLALAAAVAGVWMLATNDPPPAAPDLKGQAAHACRGFVKDRLKAPATAKFSHEQVTSLGAGRYEVNGFVDSENSFSALIRNQYDCIAAHRHGGWTLDSDVTFSEDE